ncbi:hypothetical protein NBRC116583_28580 [Arenicella sp. 4NH20-0111]|uniref:hypothetical protein n=1 Tax=Arenicella sp. 4NH20-0111 TaxID=3127648 RepID=UPI003106CACD
MSLKHGFAERKGVPLDAVSLNLIARFVRIARQNGDRDIHLQDDDILKKVSIIAHQSHDRRLRTIYVRLLQEMYPEQSTETKNQATGFLRGMGDKFKGWTKIL